MKNCIAIAILLIFAATTVFFLRVMANAEMFGQTTFLIGVQ